MGNKVKRTALAALIGSMALFGGCLSLDGWAGRVLVGAAIAAGTDFVLDNVDIIDITPNEGTAPTE